MSVTEVGTSRARPNAPRVNWPEGKRFAFSVFDDADHDWLDNVKPVYDFLADLGMLTTKSVWTVAPTHESPMGGLSTEDPRYLEWILALQARGFEIGFHGARCHTSPREDTRLALDRFRAQFGHDPISFSNHFQNADSMYWGAARLSGAYRAIYRVANFKSRLRAEGHVEGSPRFWGDLCRNRVRYVRNFVYRDINTLAACPIMPYHDASMPYVHAWYASAEGGTVDSFVAQIAEADQDRLVAEGGACIMYTHFAKGFAPDGRIHPRFEALMRRLASLGGWCVPTGTLLDWLASRNGGVHEATAAERDDLQRRWLWAKLRHGTS
jgi:hypothetical protein